MEETNLQYFSKEDVEDGKALYSFIKALIDFGNASKTHYNDIRIHQEDCGSIAVEWVQVGYKNQAEYGEFKYVGPDQYVMSELTFPDGTTELYSTEDEKEELWKEYEETHKPTKKGK